MNDSVLTYSSTVTATVNMARQSTDVQVHVYNVCTNEHDYSVISKKKPVNSLGTFRIVCGGRRGNLTNLEVVSVQMLTGTLTTCGTVSRPTNYLCTHVDI